MMTRPDTQSVDASFAVDSGRGRVSVMMPAYNAVRFIANAIDSVRAQVFTDWELIVVDDGSTDGTAEVVERMRDGRIRLIRQRNRGEAAARNVALDAAGGEYLAFLDADDLFLPDHLRVAVSFLEAHPEHAGVYTDGLYVTEDQQPLKAMSSRRRGPMSGRLFDALVRSSDVLVPSNCVVLRLSTLRRHRVGFDERIKIGSDWDFFTRVADAGTFGYVDTITCLYRLHGSNVTFQTDLQRRNQDRGICRSNAIKMPAFARCPVEVRAAAFYDLLVNILAGRPDQQQEVLLWPQFADLPPGEQARLLRLAASRTLLAVGRHAAIPQWLAQAAALNPSDRRAHLLQRLYAASPGLCRAAIRTRTAGQRRRARRWHPFADLRIEAPKRSD